ncbi:MAG: ABC transporter permease [Actinobacteria bacterium]|nr:MAG: ABC transporter permease [Actinomycetota bacterium]
MIDSSPEELSRYARLKTQFRIGLPPVLVFFVFLGLWYVVTYFVLSADRRWLLPPPHQVVAEGFFVGSTVTEILNGLWQSTKVALMGLGLAFLFGFSMALAMSQAKWIERSLYPWAVASQTVPILALVPMIGFWFGFGVLARVIVCFIISLFPIIINSLTGLLSADRELHSLFTLHNASRWRRATRLQIPAALPHIFTGLRTAAGLSVIGAIVGDFFFGRGEPGLGLLLDKYASRLQSEELFTTVFVACLLGIAVFWGFGYLGRRTVGDWDPYWAEEGLT